MASLEAVAHRRGPFVQFEYLPGVLRKLGGRGLAEAESKKSANDAEGADGRGEMGPWAEPCRMLVERAFLISIRRMGAARVVRNQGCAESWQGCRRRVRRDRAEFDIISDIGGE